MEQGCAIMEASFPAKRIRLDLPDESLPQNLQNNYPTYGRSSSLIHGNNRNSNSSVLGVDSTCDSGFNEMSPPSLEEEMMGTSVTQGVKRARSLCDEDETALPSTTSINQPPVDQSPQETAFTTNSQDENEEADDNQSVCSNESKISGMSNFDSFGDDLEGDLNAESPLYWLHQQMLRGQDPKVVLQKVLGRSDVCPKDVDDAVLWRILFNIVSTDSPPPRQRLRHLNTIEDATRLIKTSKKIIVLTGAGVSVSCGIPDFRSKDGIYARLAVDFPNLPDPQAMFDIQFFRKDPRPFFKFAKEIYPGQFIPSLCHRFIRQIESHDKLLRNYTQNIDTLEQEAGISNVIQCHGSFASATCQKCQFKVKAHVIKEQIFAQEIPMCPRCSPYPDPSIEPILPSQSTSLPENIPITETISKDKDTSLKADADTSISKMTSNPEPVLKPIMKPDIVFFGEGLPDEFHDNLAKDKDECDLLIVIGSSLKVRPVALIPSALSGSVPQILINREPLSHLTFDIELLGDCDVIINELLHRLGGSWHGICTQPEPLKQVTELSTKSEGNSSVAPPDTKESAPPSTSSAPHPKNEEDIEALRACWAPKVRESMAAKLPEGSFFYNGQHRYIFKGAEVYYDPDDTEEEVEEDDEEEEEESNLSDLETDEKGTAEGVLEKSTSLEDIVDVVQSIEEEVINSAASSSYRSASCESYQSCDESAVPSSAATSQGSAGLLGEEEGSEDWMSLRASLDSSTFTEHHAAKSKEEKEPKSKEEKLAVSKSKEEKHPFL